MKQEAQLCFKPGKKFNILCFGDIHERLIITDKESELHFRDMNVFMQVAVKALQPDFVVFLGDTLNEHDDSEGFERYRTRLAAILKPVTDAGIPFGWVFGNHEHDMNQDELVISAYDDLPGCYMFNDDPSITGSLNCNLTVKSSDGTRDAFNMWFIDSNNRCEDSNFSVYDWVHKDQIEWYERKAQELKELNGAVVPSVLFQHIPVDEEYKLFRESKLYELPVAVKGHASHSDKRFVAAVKLDGYLGEGPCSPDYNEGQFDSWKKTGDVKGAFFGHDHMNDFTGELDGILLGQNKTSGFRAYTDGCRSCVRMVSLDEDSGTISTRLYHFKDFGLESRSLGPIMKRVSDRQSINTKIGAGVAAAVIASVAVPTVISSVVKKLKK